MYLIMKSLKNFVILILLALSVSFVTSCETSKIEDEIVEQPSDNEDTDGEQDQEDENQTDDDKDEGNDGASSGDESDGQENQEEQEDQEDPNDQEEQQPEANNDEFVMLFTNDFHSQIEPTDDNLGGVLRMKALIDSVRTVEPYVLLADAGDLVQGTFYFSLLNGVVEMKVLDALGYNIRTIGNHEFDKKMAGLGDMLALSRVPVVASNYDFSNTSLAQYVAPYRILHAGKIKVGFIGLNVRLLNLVNKVACEGVVWEDAINVADIYAEELRKQGADIVIAISHLGYGSGSDAYYYDRGIAMRTRHIDMIIGGHSHTTLRKAEYVANADGDSVPIVQTGSKGLNLGYAKIKLDNDGNPTFDYRLIPVNSRLDNRIDMTFSSIIDDYAAEVKERMDVKLGYAPYNINRGTPESRLGNLTADGLIWMAKKFHNVDADVALYNTGGVRANISYGDVTLGDVYQVYPFDNVLSLITIRGNKLKRLMDEVPYNLYINAGVRMTIIGETVTSVTINGETIKDDADYTIATIDYITDNDRYADIFSGNSNREDSVEMIRDYFGEYFKHIASENDGDIDGPLDGRIKIIED